MYVHSVPKFYWPPTGSHLDGRRLPTRSSAGVVLDGVSEGYTVSLREHQKVGAVSAAGLRLARYSGFPTVIRVYCMVLMTINALYRNVELVYTTLTPPHSFSHPSE